MKVVGIVNNNHITGIEYGLIEIGDTIVEKKILQRKKFKNQIKNMKKLIKTQQRLFRTRQK